MHWLVSHTIPLSIGIESQSIDGSKMPFHASNLFLKDLSDKREISYNRTDSNSIGHKKTATEDQTLSKNLASNFPARWSVVVTAEASWPPPSTTWKSKKKKSGSRHLTTYRTIKHKTNMSQKQNSRNAASAAHAHVYIHDQEVETL